MKALKKGLRLVNTTNKKYNLNTKLYLIGIIFAFLLLMSNVVSATSLEVDSIVQLTTNDGDEQNPVWSPDGTEIAYSRDGNIYKMSLADSSEVTLTDDSYRKSGYSWSPDGTQMIFQKQNDSSIYSLWLMNEDGSSQRQIPNTNGEIDSFAWSPDGSKIAYTQGIELTLIEPDGSNKQVIYTNQPEYPGDNSEWAAALYDVAWSPDSSKIVVEESIGVEGVVLLKVLNTDGTNPIYITDALPINDHNTITPQTQSWQSQVWSPDGSKIVFETYNFHEGLASQASTVDLDGTDAIILTEQGASYPSFSPDGSKIVYEYYDFGKDANDVWMMDSDGSNKTRLTTNFTGDHRPVWSPDGSKIAFMSASAGNRDIWVMTLKEVSGNNNVITVDDDGGEDYNTIQDAIDAAKHGDTILVSPGTYYENVNVYKSVIIESTNGVEVTNVIGTSEYYPVFYVSAYKSTIKGFSISPSGESYSNGIHILESDYNTITENKITSDKGSGIYLESSEHNTIKNNKVSGDSFAAIWVVGNENTVINNNASATVHGTYISGNNNLLSNNNAEGMESSVYVRGDDNTLDYNTIYSHNIGIDESGNNNNIVNNIISNYDSGLGVLVFSSSGSILSNNTIEGGSIGVSVYESENITLDSNSLSTAGYGVILSDASNNLIYNNFFNTVVNVEFEGTNTGNQWNIERTAGNNIMGGSYLAGNYWAKPDGTGFSQNAVDTDGDGISESSYELDADNIDYLPLTDNVVLNQQPTATIASIFPISATEGESVSFAGNGTDIDGTITGYKWVSSRDGDLSASASFSTTGLSVGTHTVSFSVQDNNGAWSAVVSSSLNVSEAPVQTGNDSAPVLVSVSPTSGSTLAAGTSSVNINFSYSDNETGIDTSSVVFIFNYVDVTANGNTTIANTSAQYNATGLSGGSYNASVYVVDTAGNSATFNTNFTIAEKSSSSSSSTSRSSSSSSGGGGGGTTGEAYANIAVKEVESIFVIKDSHFSYEFTDEGNAISSVEFDSLKNSGSIQTIIEVVKDRSSFAKTDVPGQVYQQMNIWVGKTGFVRPENVENLLITFKVEKSWLTENNIETDTVMLYRYADSSWDKLSTTVTGEDDEYVYFESETPGFSPFAITSESESVSAEEDILQSVADDTADSVSKDLVSDNETKSTGFSVTGILLVLGLLAAVLVGGYVQYGKRN